MRQPPVLLVDDDDFVVTSLRRDLEGSGGSLVAISKSVTASFTLQRWQWWRAILVDLNLHDIRAGIHDHSGVSLAWFARTTYPGIPIAFYTAYEVEWLRKAAAARNIAYFLKPFDSVLTYLRDIRRDMPDLPPASVPYRRAIAETIQHHDLSYATGEVLFVQAEAWARTGAVLRQTQAASLLGITARAYQKRVNRILAKVGCFALEELFRQLDTQRGQRVPRTSGIVLSQPESEEEQGSGA